MQEGFYKFYKDTNNIFYGESIVVNKDYTLKREEKDDYQYPIDGWYWFDSIQEAYSFFGLELPEETVNDN